MLTLEEQIIGILRKQNKTIAVAESLTGGMVSQRLVNVSGASNAFKGSVTAYMLVIKESVLGIPLTHTSKTDGVDYETAKLMAKNVAILMNSDYGIGTTGIAEAWDDRPEQAFISFYDRKKDEAVHVQIIFGDEIKQKKNIRQSVREETTEKTLWLCLWKLQEGQEVKQ